MADIFYCEIDENGYCYHVTADMLPLRSTVLKAEQNMLGKIWNGEKWNDLEQTTEPETEPTPLSEQEEIALDTALNVEYMVCLMEESLGLE